MEIPLESFENPLENLRRAFNEERSSSILPRRKRSPMHQKRKGSPIPAKVESLPLHQGEDKLTHPSKKEELTNALERKSLRSNQGGSPTQCTQEQTSPPKCSKKGGAYQCAKVEKSSHPTQEGAPPNAPSRSQAQSVHQGWNKFTHPTKELSQHY